MNMEYDIDIIKNIPIEKKDIKINLENTESPFTIKIENNTISLSSTVYGVMPRNGGEWVEKDKVIIWKPDQDVIPDPTNGKNGNPDGKTWGEILKKYKIVGIEFKDGYPDFTPISKADIIIDDFSKREINFPQADRKLAEQWSKQGKDGKEWSAGDVKQWRKDNNYTWHEHQDCKTMQLVPCEVHNNIPHDGGIAVKKKELQNQ